MMTLKRGSHGPALAKLEPAFGLWARTRGLLGRPGLAPATALWIRPCNSVHTFFMKFALDLVFLDGDLTVRKVYRNVGPGRLIWPVWRAKSVLEFEAGFLNETSLSPGETLYVDHTLS